MTKSEMFKILDSVIIENDFWLSEMDECREKNFDLMENITSIFKMEKARDFTLLMASIKLLCKDPVPVIDYFREENKREIQFEEPVRNDLLIIATVFQTNPVFFSMCWNFVAMIENELASTSLQSQNKNIILVTANAASKSSSNNNVIDFRIDFDIEIEALKFAASKSSEGWGENITKIPVENLGELKILGDSDTQQVAMDFFIVEECQTMQFELTVEFELKGESLFVVLRKETSEKQSVISTEPIDIDFSLGLKIKRISCKPL